MSSMHLLKCRKVQRSIPNQERPVLCARTESKLEQVVNHKRLLSNETTTDLSIIQLTSKFIINLVERKYFCGDCGKQLTPEEKPCSSCGSPKRRIEVTTEPESLTFDQA